ncbi:MAG: site-2 protease family protein [Clostridia bacterium]|nr:site-2 protease family protein [Clostridia bacterium]
MITAIVSVVMFLVMISLHEFGHFIVAKALKFRVDEFSVGMGPLILKKQKGETQYSLRALPLGGYCKFDEDNPEDDDPRAFVNQKAWKRLIVLLAGGVFNIILGFVLFIVVVFAISPVRTNVVESVVPNSYIEQSGMQAGDTIVAINGKGVSFYNDISLYTQNFTKDENAQLTVKRNGENIDFDFKPTEQIIETTYTENGADIKTTVNGATEEARHADYSDSFVKDDSIIGKTETVTRYIIGFTPAQKNINIFNVWGEAWNETKFVVKLVYQSLWQIITGKIGIREMSGPVGIVNEVNTAVNSGSMSWLYVINLVALLTINLGVFNLLPIPALDGGRILFVLWEMITGKRIPPDKEGIVHAIGMALLLLLVLVISFSDIMKLFGG